MPRDPADAYERRARREPIATPEEVKAQQPHPRELRSRLAFGGIVDGKDRIYCRVRCGSCGETAYGANSRRADLALAESSCLPVERAWNDRMFAGVCAR